MPREALALPLNPKRAGELSSVLFAGVDVDPWIVRRQEVVQGGPLRIGHGKEALFCELFGRQLNSEVKVIIE